MAGRTQDKTYEQSIAARPVRRTLNITETAHRNHEELFPNHQSTLRVTDPELIEVFDNFAFDKVLAQSNLDTKTRVMMILA